MPPISFWGDPNWLIANVLDWFLRDLPAKVVHWPMLKYPCWKERFEVMSHSEDLNEWLSLVSCLEDLNMPSISSRYSVYTLGSGFIFCPYLGKGSVLPYSFEIGWRNHHRHKYSFAHLGSFECTRILILGGFKFPGVVKHGDQWPTSTSTRPKKRMGRLCGPLWELVSQCRSEANFNNAGSFSLLTKPSPKPN